MRSAVVTTAHFEATPPDDVGHAGQQFYEMMKRLLLYRDPPDHDRIRHVLC